MLTKRGVAKQRPLASQASSPEFLPVSNVVFVFIWVDRNCSHEPLSGPGGDAAEPSRPAPQATNWQPLPARQHHPMLLVQGTPLLDVRLEALLEHAYLAAQTQAFLAQQRLCVPASCPALCVLQGEQALLSPTRGNAPGVMQLLGSQDATTCVIAVLRCRETHACWAAHLDSLPSQQAVADMQQALALMRAPALYLVGGYADAKGAGPRLAQGLLLLLHSQTALGAAPPIHLELACIGTANSAADGLPRAYALVVDVQQGTAHPWTFECRGPQLPRRMAAQHCRDSPAMLVPVWDAQRQLLVLAGFDATLPSWYVMELELRLRMSDAQLLACMSTSPAHEPEWFVEDMRAMMRWLIAMQSADAQDLSYQWDAEAEGWRAVARQRQQQHRQHGGQQDLEPQQRSATAALLPPGVM